MAGFFGTERRQALQRHTYDRRHWIAATPGIYNAGRFMGIDDPDKQPWPSWRRCLSGTAFSGSG